MEELVKAIRVLHRAVMLASGAVMILALAPKNTGRYSSALPELTGLVEILSQGITQHMARFAKEGDAIPIHDLMVRYPDVQPTGREQSPDFASLVEIQPLDPQSTISQLHAFFNSPNWWIIVPDSAEFAAAVAPLRPNCESCGVLPARIYRDQHGAWTVEFETLEDRVSHRFEVFDSDTIPGLLPGHLGRLWLASVMDSVSADGSRWGISHAFDPILIDLTAGAGGVFPRLQPIWSEVRDFFPREALAVTHERLSAAENTLQFIGISMSERVALILVIPGMIILMLTLCSNLLSLSSGNPKDVKDAIVRLPILVFQSSLLARSLSLTTLVIVPTVSVWFLSSRALSSPEEISWQFWTYVSLSIFVFLISVQVFRLTEQVRKGGLS